MYLIYQNPNNQQTLIFSVQEPIYLNGQWLVHLRAYPAIPDAADTAVALPKNHMTGNDPFEDAVAWLTGIDGPYANALQVSEENIDYKILQLDMLRRVRLRRNSHRDGGHNLGVNFGNKVIDTDIDSRINILGGVAMAQLAVAQSQPFSQDWRMKDNSYVTLDAPAMIAVGMSVGQFMGVVQHRKNTLDQLILDTEEAEEPLTELEALENEINLNWPT